MAVDGLPKFTACVVLGLLIVACGGTSGRTADSTASSNPRGSTRLCEIRDPARVCMTVKGNALTLAAYGLAPKSRLTTADSQGGRSFGSSDANGRAELGRVTGFGRRISVTFIGTSATAKRFVATIHWAAGKGGLPSRADDPTTKSCGDVRIAAMQSGEFGRGCVPSDTP